MGDSHRYSDSSQCDYGADQELRSTMETEEMMNFNSILRRARKTATDNTPAILTAIGVTGTIATAVLAGKASFKAAELIAEHEEVSEKFHMNDVTSQEEYEKNLSFKTKADLVWKLYVPAIGTGAVTIACIVASNHVSTKRAAALASAYTISQEACREYKDKVLEKLGEKKEQELRDEISQDRVNRNPLGTFIVSNANALCLDLHSGRYFRCDMETIRKAENDINYRILGDNYASLTDFWEKVGLDRTSESDEIGWNSDMKLEVIYATALADNNEPCITLEFRKTPIRGFHKTY